MLKTTLTMTSKECEKDFSLQCGYGFNTFSGCRIQTIKRFHNTNNVYDAQIDRRKKYARSQICIDINRLLIQIDAIAVEKQVCIKPISYKYILNILYKHMYNI